MSPAMRGRRAVFPLVFLVSSTFALPVFAKARGGHGPAMSAPRPMMSAPTMRPPVAVHRPMVHRTAPMTVHRPQIHQPRMQPGYGAHRPVVHRRPLLVSAPVAPPRIIPVLPQLPIVMQRGGDGRWARHHGVHRPHPGHPHRPQRPGLHYNGGGIASPYVDYAPAAAAPAYSQAYEPPLVHTHGEPPVIPAYGYESCVSPLVIHIGAGAESYRAPVTHGQMSECGRPQIVHYNRPHAGNTNVHAAPARVHQRRAKKAPRKKGIAVVRARY